ncbi:MAG: dTDP-4-dehydrorhamnose 3,5-epimerase [Pelagibacterales bacterium]|nr:dTDP-4-dehydrorhamnose 3,5-epimerase [Pelagibacterales bacterium]
MKLVKTKIKDLLIVKTEVYKDKRGFFKEIIKKKYLNKNFIFDCLSSSKKNTLRGLHIQLKNKQAKLITVVEGKILDVVVDLRKKSKTFGKTFSLIMSDKSDFSFFIPAGFAHGFLCLSKKCAIYYKCTHYQDRNSEKTLVWNDKKLNIKWGIKKPILSKKDQNGLSLNNIKRIL